MIGDQPRAAEREDVIAVRRVIETEERVGCLTIVGLALEQGSRFVETPPMGARRYLE